MRKPRDIDSELKALAERAKQLKERRIQQLGELVIATGADALDAETLAGDAVEDRRLPPMGCVFSPEPDVPCRSAVRRRRLRR